MEISEFFIELITFILITLGIVGMVFQSASFEGDVQIYNLQRTSIDLAQAAMSAPCLAEVVDGEIREGILVSEKLSDAQRTGNLCFDVDGTDFSIEVSTDSSSWLIGDTVYGNIAKRYPVAVLEKNGEIIPGDLIVRVSR